MSAASARSASACSATRLWCERRTQHTFSSQRNPGETFEVTGPFLGTAPVPSVGGWGTVLLVTAISAFGSFAARRNAAKTD